jgi:hypothetical protein
MLKALYVIAIGLLFAGLVGFGFAAFYPAPAYPEYPRELNTPTKTDGTLTEEERAIQQRFEEESKIAQDKQEVYNRNLSIWLIVSAIAIMAVSILGLGKIEVIGDGLTLGGVFTLLYGLGRAMAAGDEKTRFVAVAVGLVILVFLTYWKFIRGHNVSEKVS